MTIYTNTARFDTGRALTEDEMRGMAPSIFANTAHASRSDRFKPIPTIEVLRALSKEGFMPVGVKQSRTRDPSRGDFTKHLIRLRNFGGDVKKYQVGDTVHEMLLKNANDGTAQYDLMSGLFRIACLNSLVAQTSTLSEIKVRHTGADVAQKVVDATFTVVDEAEKALAAPADWSQLQLTHDARNALAEAAHVLRFGDAEGHVDTPIRPEQFLIPRRREDARGDLWTTFNVVQENTIRGGMTAMGRDANNRRRRTTTRDINGIDQDVKLNKALWILGERMAGILKTAA